MYKNVVLLYELRHPLDKSDFITINYGLKPNVHLSYSKWVQIKKFNTNKSIQEEKIPIIWETKFNVLTLKTLFSLSPSNAGFPQLRFNQPASIFDAGGQKGACFKGTCRMLITFCSS